MDKRYQVFVSSTYTDLIEERQVVMQTLMENDCIPAGMELFPAADEDQFEFIKRIIDDCDYYLIIIGGRYGSLAADGISFTEKEYDYAISRGLKVIALVHSNSDQIIVGKSEKDKKSKIKLEKFRAKVCKGRIVKFWDNKNQISGILSPSLSKTMKLFPAIGWVRANQVASVEILEEINSLRKENDELKSKMNKKRDFEKTIESYLQKEITLTVTIISTAGLPRQSEEIEQWNVKLIDVFRVVSKNILAGTHQRSDISYYLCRDLYLIRKSITESQIDRKSFHLDDDSYVLVRSDLVLLELVEIETQPSTWYLTQRGKEFILSLLTDF
jgi:Domain of unknown function (DUF4062)